MNASWLPAGLRRHVALGARGERLAARHLRRRRYRILARNYRCPAGEIDLVAADGDTLVFVEVKTRRADVVAFPEDAVNPVKRRQLTRVARFFCAAHQVQHLPARFDVISIILPARGRPDLEHFVNAFPPQGGRR